MKVFRRALASLALLIAAAGCGGGDDSPPAPTPTTPTVTPAAADCALLSAAEVGRLTGVDHVLARPPAGDPGYCRYDRHDGRRTVLGLGVFTGAATGKPATILAAFDHPEGHRYVPVAGIGDAANYEAGEPRGGHELDFVVVAGDTATVVLVSLGADVPGGSRPLVEKIARAVEAKV